MSLDSSIFTDWTLILGPGVDQSVTQLSSDHQQFITYANALQLGCSILFIIHCLYRLVCRKNSSDEQNILNPGRGLSLISQGLLIGGFTLCFQDAVAQVQQEDISQWMRLASTGVGAMASGLIVSTIIRGCTRTPRMLYTSAMLIPASWILLNERSRAQVLIVVGHTVTFASDLWLESHEPLSSLRGRRSPSIFAKAMFGQVNPLFYKEWSEPITPDDLPFFPDICQPLDRLLRDKDSSFPSFRQLLRHVCAKELFLGLIFQAIDIACKLALPTILSQFLRTQKPKWIVAICVLSLVDSVASTQNVYLMRLAGVKAKSALVQLIFDRLVKSGRSSSHDPSIVNLVEIDTQRVLQWIAFLNATWSAPVQILVCLISIASLIGYQSALLGFASLMFMIPLWYICTSTMYVWSQKAMVRRDGRMGLTTEVLSKVPAMKFHSLESGLEKRLDKLRSSELDCFEVLQWVSAGLNVLMRCAPTVLSVVVFMSAGFFGRHLDAEEIFPALLLFSLLTYPLGLIPTVIGSWADSQVSYQRLLNFCSASEMDEMISASAAQELSEMRIDIQNLSYSWPDAGAKSELLSHISFRARKGELITLSGHMSEGKSTLLKLLLGALRPNNGSIEVSGDTAFMPQESWLITGTIRENIILGLDYDEEFYKRVVSACALEDDLAGMEQGDLTSVGSSVAGLSGGQKSRICLARTIYSRAQIYLIDDPIAAVDSRVQKHLVREVFGSQGLLKDCIRIVATNSESLVRIANHSYTLFGGSLEQAIRPFTTGEEGLGENEISSSNNEEIVDCSGKVCTVQATVVAIESDPQPIDPTLDSQILDTADENATTVAERETHAPPSALIPTALYLRWARLAGIWRWLLISALICASYFSSIYSSYVLKQIANMREHNRGLALYTATSAIQGLLIFTWLISAWYICQKKTSQQLHRLLVHGVFRSPLQFFSSVPPGEIINRFANDITRADMALYGAFYGIINALVRLIGSVGVLIVYSPASMALILCLSTISFWMFRGYVSILVGTRRLETHLRGPLLTNLQETGVGYLVIRSLRRSDYFQTRNFLRLSESISAYLTTIALEGWLTFRLSIFSVVLITFSATLFTMNRAEPSTVGFVMAYVLQVSGCLIQTVSLLATAESEMVSIQRIFQMVDLKPEGSEQTNGMPVPAFWPQHGTITFDNYSTKYDNSSQPVLRKINLEIKPREHVAIVGRTGAGKSSLVSGLFRILEASGGQIRIDGIDISRVQLDTLRTRMTIIPQDFRPFLGSVRNNLDPEGLYDDTELIQAMQDSTFLDGFENPEDALTYLIGEAGSSLSTGQMQLLAISHAILNNSNIIVMDEATSAIDHDTESRIQQVLQNQFKNKTMIIIAHRLRTVLGCDKIVVLDHGQIKEYGSPNEVYHKNGIFTTMVQDAGLEASFSIA